MTQNAKTQNPTVASSNVVSLSASDLPKKKKGDDMELIRDCVGYAHATGALQAGFLADPDGNSETAGGPMGSRLTNRAHRLLSKISRTPANTAKGLQAKARIVPMVFENGAADVPDQRDIDFLETFASEVKEFLKPLIERPISGT